ncbi:MAG: EscU/YscU/HrcU family type III secretion system export apparatus switch protein [Oscillospiraceae bacterium]|jgi:flagellar biosynthesis protein
MSKSDIKAAALRYEPDSDLAPVVIASGYGEIAERIINIAEQSGIPVYRDDSVSSMLCMLDVGKNIPPDLYEIIAKIYCSILSTAEKFKKTAPESK